jgi:hypothetical protein
MNTRSPELYNPLKNRPVQRFSGLLKEVLGNPSDPKLLIFLTNTRLLMAELLLIRAEAI